ncbi:MAG: hypothetical protein GQ531_11615 [Sulfurovum sp.]|nr:hypothetical protein [Sulfurovum sp.]
MKKYLSLLLFSLLFTAQATVAEEMCYKADKSNFNYEPDTPRDIIIDLRDLESKNWIALSFSSFIPLPYADSNYSFYCIEDETKPNLYNCSADCDGGRMTMRIEDGHIEVNIDHARMTNSPEDTVMHSVESKKETFTSAKRITCPKPHTFKNKNEKYLPFVCYSSKHIEETEGKTHLQYWACTRHSQACETIDAQHFGRYPNDDESYKAYLRCENSTPR